MTREIRLQQLRNMVLNDNIHIQDMIDIIIEENGIIGVGLISLARHISNYIIHPTEKIKYQEWIKTTENDKPKENTN